MLALAAIRPRKTPVRFVVALILVAMVFGTFLIARSLISDDAIWPGSEVARRNRWIHNHLKKTEAWETRPVIFLVGSSATNYGIDPLRLEKELQSSGINATVLSFCMPGDNHYERIYMLRQFLGLLSEADKKKLRRTTVFFLGEIFDSYDKDPVYRMEKDAFSERSIKYLNPQSSWQSWHAYRTTQEANGALESFDTGWLLLQHALLNRFAVGTFSSMNLSPMRKRKTPPFFPLEGVKSSFDAGLAIQKIRKYQPPAASLASLPAPWALMNRDYRDLMDPYVDNYGFYALPMLEPARISYAHSFARAVPSDHLVFGPPTPGELEAMLASENWFDGVHPTGLGAEKFTLWLANQLTKVLRQDKI